MLYFRSYAAMALIHGWKKKEKVDLFIRLFVESFNRGLNVVFQ
jgi:hypothetical protein